MSQSDERAERIYQFIKHYRDENGISPTLREIGKACEMSHGTVGEYLSRLEAQGKIAREPYKSRSIRLTEKLSPDDELAEIVYEQLLDAHHNKVIPSQREMAEACFISQTEVRRALAWLEGQGRIKRGEGQRNIRIIELNN